MTVVGVGDQSRVRERSEKGERVIRGRRKRMQSVSE